MQSILAKIMPIQMDGLQDYPRGSDWTIDRLMPFILDDIRAFACDPLIDMLSAVRPLVVGVSKYAKEN